MALLPKIIYKIIVYLSILCAGRDSKSTTSVQVVATFSNPRHAFLCQKKLRLPSHFCNKKTPETGVSCKSAPGWSWFDTAVLLFNDMEPQLQQPGLEKHPVHQITPLSKYLALSLFIILPFIGGYTGYRMAPEKVVEVTSWVTDMEPDLKIVQKGEGEPLYTLEEVESPNSEAIQSYLNQRLSTVAVFDAPDSSVQIAVAADRNSSVYCGYDNGPCYFFLQAYNANYPRIKYLGSMDSVGVFKTDTVKFTSSSTFQFSTSFGDAGVGIHQVWEMNILTGSSTKISEERTEADY